MKKLSSLFLSAIAAFSLTQQAAAQPMAAISAETSWIYFDASGEPAVSVSYTDPTQMCANYFFFADPMLGTWPPFCFIPAPPPPAPAPPVRTGQTFLDANGNPALSVTIGSNGEPQCVSRFVVGPNGEILRVDTYCLPPKR